MSYPHRGEVWMVDLDPPRGREQAGKRPAVVISANAFNAGPADLVIVVPITSRDKGIPLHVLIQPPEGGLKVRSFVKCEDIRSVSKDRLARRLGKVSTSTLAEVEDRLRIVMQL